MIPTIPHRQTCLQRRKLQQSVRGVDTCCLQTSCHGNVTVAFLNFSPPDQTSSNGLGRQGHTGSADGSHLKPFFWGGIPLLERRPGNNVKGSNLCIFLLRDFSARGEICSGGLNAEDSCSQKSDVVAFPSVFGALRFRLSD